MKTVHPGVVKPIFRCSYCSELFSNGDALSSHVRMNHKCECYQCSVCSRAFSINRSLVIHMRTHSGEKPYQCTICEKKFSHTSSLQYTPEKTHRKKSLTNVRFVIRILPIGIALLHISLHTPVKNHIGVPFVSRAFIYRNSLSAHMRTHTCNGEKSHKCSVCGNGFTHAYGLSLHMRTHTCNGEKSHKCSVCGNGFAHAYGLSLHMRTHTGRKNLCVCCL